MKKETVKTTEKAPVAKQKKVLYSVSTATPSNVGDQEFFLYDSLEEAYNIHVQNEGYGETLYAYKIEYMGEVSMQLTIKQ